MRSLRKLALIIPVLVLAGCGQGDGPTPIPGTPAPPPPPAGICDPTITFEEQCGELPGIIPFNGGITAVIANPDKSGINTSDTVAEMQKFGNFPDSEVFGGTKLSLPAGDAPVDFSQGEIYLVKVWSRRDVPVSFKLEEPGFPGGGLTEDVSHTGGSEWQELCFDFTGQTGAFPVSELTIIFDGARLGEAELNPDDWTFYYDDIEQVRECEPGLGTPIDPDATLYSTSGDPTLVIPDDYAERTAFGSGSVIDPLYADDEFFSPVLSVWSGTGYGANVAQVGFIGFPTGFLGAYESVDFKIKGMPNQVVFVKLYDGVDTLRINLTSSAFSGALAEEGWFQVSIPVDRFSGVDSAAGIVFESDNTSVDQFRMLLTDIGFSGMGTGGPLPPFDGGLLTNGDFQSGTSPWLAGIDNPIGMENVISDPADVRNSIYFVDVTAAGNPFDVNLSQRGLTITPDETYELTFRARSNVSRTMLAGIGLSGGSFANVTEEIDLTADWQDFTVTLTATGFGDTDSRVLFDMGAAVGEVYIDNVRLVVAPEPPFDGGLVTNGDFESGTSPWLAGVDNPIGTENVIDDMGNSVYFVDVTAAGNPFDVNLSQRGLTITPDETYTLSFKARSNVSRSMLAGIGLSGGDFSNVTQTVDLTSDWQTFTVDLTAAGFGDNDSRVLFDMGAAVGEVYIDDVSLVVAPPPPASSELLTNGDFETGALVPWLDGSGGGIPTVTDTNQNGGTFSVNLTAGQLQNVFIRQENLGGPFTAGDEVTVTFDITGTLTNSSITPQLLGQGAPFATLVQPDVDMATWSTKSYTVTLEADQPALSFQIGGACGDVPTCVVNIFLDNISVQAP